METFKISEVLVIRPISEDNPTKKEFIKKNKRKKKQTEEENKKTENNSQQGHIDVYV